MKRTQARPRESFDPSLDVSALSSLLARFAGRRILLLGDLVLDEFAYGEIARVSREAPVLILDYKESRYAPGGGANAAANLAALGARVVLAGRVGRDPAGDQLLAMCEERGIERTCIIRDDGYQTPIKTRILAGSAHTSKQQVVRVDRGSVAQPLAPAAARTLRTRADKELVSCAALLVADYGFGAATPGIHSSLGPKRPIVTLDSRFRIGEFRGVTAATPNVAELEQALGTRVPDDDPAALAQAGSRLLQALEARALVVTRGSRGMSLFEPGSRPLHFPPFGSDEIADVTGAGDTVVSAFTLALAAGGSFSQATCLANVAGGLVVMKRGTATVSLREIADALKGGNLASATQD